MTSVRHVLFMAMGHPRKENKELQNLLGQWNGETIAEDYLNDRL